MNGVAQKAVWSTADVHRDEKQLLKIFFQRIVHLATDGLKCPILCILFFLRPLEDRC